MLRTRMLKLLPPFVILYHYDARDPSGITTSPKCLSKFCRVDCKFVVALFYGLPKFAIVTYIPIVFSFYKSRGPCVMNKCIMFYHCPNLVCQMTNAYATGVAVSRGTTGVAYVLV